MPLTDPEGNAIPADDPRLPSAHDLLTVRATVAKLQAVIEANGGQIGPLLDVQATVETLVSLFVPPDEDDPTRRLFEIRVAQRKEEILMDLIRSMQEKAAGPRLVVPGASIPKDLLRGPGG